MNHSLGETLRMRQSTGLLAGDRPPPDPPRATSNTHCAELACSTGLLKLCALSDFSARTRAAAGMVEELPASPQVLRRDDVSLLRADETVFNAMADFIETQSA